MYKLGLEKAKELEIKLPTFAGSQRKQGNFRKTPISVSYTTLKPLTVWIMTNLESSQQDENTCMRVKKQQLEPCMEQPIGSGLRKEYDGAVCYHPVCLTYTLSTS